ncbi:MAG: hypothetical protein GC151_03075 [Betaproteobacteria bacterium]|nr:hypothetical protein [Betaproteobacteria bacterium]
MRPLLVSLPFCCILFAQSPFAHADRISDMTREEKCVYTARLQVAAAYYFTQGKAREDVKIHWHGDETENEIQFVTLNVDAGYAAMKRAVAASGRGIPVEVIGDKVYETCMRETAL